MYFLSFKGTPTPTTPSAVTLVTSEALGNDTSVPTSTLSYITQIITTYVTQIETEIVSTENTDSTEILSASTSYDKTTSKFPTGIGIILSNPMVTGK